MARVAHIKRHAIERIDRYFSDDESAADLRAWAVAHPVFANPKELDNSEDWMVSNALALMAALMDTAADRAAIEQGLREARRFLSGEEPFPEDRWPVGLVKS
jgi:hypothetical protein